MTHISFRITEKEKMDYAMLTIYEDKTLTALIKRYLDRLVKKHSHKAK